MNVVALHAVFAVRSFLEVARAFVAGAGGNGQDRFENVFVRLEFAGSASSVFLLVRVFERCCLPVRRYLFWMGGFYHCTGQA